MNKELIKYTPTEGAPQKCHACAQPNEALNQCAGCTLFFYCDRCVRSYSAY